MKNNHFLFLIVNLIVSTISLHAQVVNDEKSIIPKIISLSPQAASLGQYGLKSIDLFTGKPEINIDLYSLKVGDYSFPIRLSYNTYLVKPNEHPGIMGLGWSLISGGVVTRSVRGGVDEYLVHNYNRNSYYDDPGVLNRDNWYTSSFLDTLDAGLKSNFPTGPYQLRSFPAPDMFSFNVNGFNGTFFKNHLGEWEVTSSKNIDVQIMDSIVHDFGVEERLYTEFNNVIAPRVKRMIYGFRITDDRGCQYIFGMQPNSIEFSATPDPAAGEYNADIIANTWHLTKIILPNTNQTIEFTYSNDQRMVLKYYTGIAIGNFKVNGLSQEYIRDTNTLAKNLYVYLSSIKTDGVEINFYKSHSNDLDYEIRSLTEQEKVNLWYPYHQKYGPVASEIIAKYTDPSTKHWYKLDSMVVRSLISEERLYKVIPSYLENQTTRLFLTGLEEFGSNDTDSKTYSFGYTDTHLPAYGTGEVDHWGFYNGRDFFKSVQPGSGYTYSQAQLNTVFPEYKEAASSLSISNKGYLNYISYPTKGTDILVYEQNSYSSVVHADFDNYDFQIVKNSSNKKAGGLRIKKIISHPGNDLEVLTREYFYVNDLLNGDTSSSGILSGKPTYFEKANDGLAFEYFKFKSYPVLTDNSTNGNHITYSRVYEVDNSGGLKEYTFTNHDNGFGDTPAIILKSNVLVKNWDNTIVLMNQLKFNSLEHERGQPLLIRYYDDQENPLRKEVYDYRGKAVPSNAGIRNIDYQSEFFGEPVSDGSFTNLSMLFEARKISAYETYTYHSYLKSKTITDYNPSANDSVVNIENYYYNEGLGHQLKRFTTHRSDGKQFRRSYRYPTDYISDPVYASMVHKNIISPVVEDSAIVNNSLEKLIKINYGEFNPTGQRAFLLPATVQHKFGNGPWIMDYTVNSYTPKGQISEILHPTGVFESYLWGYNFEYPIAKVKSSEVDYNAALGLMGNGWSVTNSPYLSEQTLYTALRNLREKLKDSQLWTYTHKPQINISSETESSGRTTFYEYDSFGRLKNIKESNDFLVQSYDYGYSNKTRPHLYVNIKKSQSFIVSCNSTDLIGDEIVYSVEEGTYYSLVSQEDADQKALDDIQANGQRYANEHGGCKVVIAANNIGLTGDVIGVLQFTGAGNQIFTLGNGTPSIKLSPGNYTIKFATPGAKALFDINGESFMLVDNLPGGETILGTFSIGGGFYISASTNYYANVLHTRNFVKNNCGSGLIGSTVTYTVSSNKYFSLSSQAEANQKAVDDINTNGQNHANNVGACNTVVSVGLQKTSSVNNFNPVRVQFIPTGLTAGTIYSFPTTNTGTSNISVASGTYQLNFTTPISVPFPVSIYLNGQHIGNVPAGLTSYSLPATFSGGISYIMKAVVGDF